MVPENQRTISNEEINQLPQGAYTGEIQVIDTAALVRKAFSEMIERGPVGFDTETKPVFVKGHRNKVAMLQVALQNKVFLFRLNVTGLTAEMKSFLGNPEILKIGIAIRDDIKALQRLGNFKADGFVELTTLTKAAGYEVESVKKLTALLLGFRISKSAQTSNWEAPTLNSKQCSYAATDAWTCLQIYERVKVPLMWDSVP